MVLREAEALRMDKSAAAENICGCNTLRLRFLLHFLAIYSAAFFHFLIFVRNVPKGATVLTWINL